MVDAKMATVRAKFAARAAYLASMVEMTDSKTESEQYRIRVMECAEGAKILEDA